jgi:two-component system, cell cycle sensor histidine kinase and response regulator CckA
MATGGEIRDGKRKEDALQRHEWGHDRKVMVESQPPGGRKLPLQAYGDLTTLNTSRLILDSVGPALLSDIVSDFLELLGTSCAVYEKNGDYALRVCSSGWCRLLDLSSQQHCGESDNRQALKSGRWHCHESCWNEAARGPMETGRPADVACRGGIRLFAVPIRAGEEIIGSISVGYGDPPRDPGKLQELAAAYGVRCDELREEAEAYATRPIFVVEWAKKRVLFSARLIGEIVGRKQAEQALRESEEKYSAAVQQAKDGVIIIQDQTLQFVNLAMADMLGYTTAEVENMPFSNYLAPEHRAQVVAKLDARLAGEDVPPVYDTGLLHKDGTVIEVELSASVIQYRGRPADAVIIRDIRERKRAEEALRQSEEAYRLLFEQSVDGIVITVQGKIVEANSAFCALHGSPLDRLLGIEAIDLIHTEDRDVAIQRLRSLQSGERIVESYVYRSAVHNASPRWMGVRSKLIKWDGQLAIQSIVRDITEQKRAEEALRESEARFRRMVEFSPLPIGIATDAGMVEYLNPKFIETFGYTIEDMPHLTDWYDLAYPDAAYRKILKEKWQKALEKATARHSATRSIEAEVLCKDGSKRIMKIWGTIVGNKFLVIFNDLTARKQVEKALQESNETLRTLIQAAPVAIIAFGTEGKVKLWNPAAERMFGWREEEVVGQFLPHVGKEQLGEHESLRERVLRGEIFTGVEIRRHRRDGSPIDMNMSAAPLHDAEGNFSGVMSVNVDITERKRAEEERARLEAQMREVQKLESLGVLTGGIAHDFNNILMAILGNADLALARLPSAAPARRNVEEITRSSQRAADLCRQMVAYSGKGRFVVGRCDLSEIVRKMAQILEVSISKKASVRYALAEKLPAVEADVTQMRQVVMNLITNASEALDGQSGIITVSSGVVECDLTCLSESYVDDRLPEGSYVTFEVSDTGCGMDEDTLSKIFDPFFTTKFVGRGLGLAAVLGIVRGHKGAIRVSSEPGKGTTFTVLLPALELLPGETAQDEEPSAPPPHEGCILLIDDDPAVRNVGSEMLTLLGFQVLTAADGVEGLEVFRAHRDEIDCIILDLSMPHMGGEEAFRELRRLRSDARVILSSGYNEQEITQRFVGQGLAGFVQKPYSVAKLLETLSRVLG